MLTPITPGRYRMRNGLAAEVRQISSFAYGRRETEAGFKGDYWNKESGVRVKGGENEAEPNSEHFDLMERLDGDPC